MDPLERAVTRTQAKNAIGIAVWAERQRCAEIAERAARMQTADEAMRQFAFDIAAEIRDNR